MSILGALLGRHKQPVARAIVTYRPPNMPQLDMVHRGTSGWAPMPGSANPSQQIGMYAGGMLTQFPVMPRGVQLHSVREFGNSRWFYPSVQPLPNGSQQQSQKPANIAGGQRTGSRYTGPVGPVTARLFRAAVAEAQVRQSGLSAQDWAQGLSN